MGISCLLYQPKLAALGSGELPEPLALRVERHLSACPSCQREWELQERLSQALRSASPQTAPVSPYLWERLEAAIEAEGVPAPHRSVFRPQRLAPIGGFLLAGAALAAVFVARVPQGTVAAKHEPLQVAQVNHPQVSLASPAPSAPSALELARRTELPLPPSEPADDPFAPRSSQVAQVQPSSAQLIRQVRHTRPLGSRRSHPPVAEPTDLPTQTRATALAQLEQGTVHLQTAEFNREVKEAEEQTSGPAQRVTCAPTEAIASARGEANLGIFQ